MNTPHFAQPPWINNQWWLKHFQSHLKHHLHGSIDVFASSPDRATALLRLRKTLHVNQECFSQLLGVHVNTIKTWEHHTHSYRIGIGPHAQRIADLAGCLWVGEQNIHMMPIPCIICQPIEPEQSTQAGGSSCQHR